MKNQNERELTPQYCESPKRKFRMLLAHLMCHCLLVTQFVLPTQALAQDSNNEAPTQESIGLTVEEANNQRDANLEQERQAAIQGGVSGTCAEHDEVIDTNYERIQALNNEWTDFTTNQTDALNLAIGGLAGTLGQQVQGDGSVVAATGGPNLLAAQAAYSSTYGVQYPDDADPALISAYETAKQNYIDKSDTKRAADQRYEAARRARSGCMGRETNCPTSVIQEFNSASAAKQQADRQYSAAYNNYKAKRNALAGEDGNDQINDIEDPFFAKEQRYDNARNNLSVVQDELRIAQRELQAAQNVCQNFCTAADQNRLREAQRNVATAQQNIREADQEYRAARSAYRNAPRGMANDSQQAVNSMSDGANAMTSSHQISGCAPIDAASAGTFDITQNTSEECALGGPLFDADENVARIAREGIDRARTMAASRADLLFDMELREQFSEDVRLYELAVNGAYVNENGQSQRVNENFEEIDSLDSSDTRKTKNLQLAISNIKTVGAASAIVKDMVCEKHDVSEVDSKSYHIIRAGAATWLMAVVNDTDYHENSSLCFSDNEDEQLAGDRNNEQIQSVERAALLHDQQLQSMCLRMKPRPIPDDYDPNNPDHYKNYGDTPEEAARYIDVIRGYSDGEYTYPPLALRCKEYFEAIRGEDYENTPMTRDYAIEMVTEALGLAVEELAAKRQKIATAYANVLKGRAWVKKVEANIKMMLALAAVIFAAYMVMRGICPTPGGGWACGIASALNSKYVYITGTVVGIWLMMELARAKKFLAKWEDRLDKAKFFHHMACNFEDANAEETLMADMGDRAKQQKDVEIENARRRAINQVNRAVDGAVRTQLNNANSTSSDNQNQTYIPNDRVKEIYFNQLNAGLNLVKNENSLVSLFSSISNELNSKEKIKTYLKTLGLELMEVMVPSAQANSLVRDERRDQRRAASSLSITEGTESFRYFLVQRNQQYQNLTNDITNQPRHSPDDSEISPASGNIKNINNAVIRTVDQLAAPYTGGATGDPLDGLSELEKLGFPTPETRVATIQALLELFIENRDRLNGGLAEIAFQRDQYVQLLDQMRKRMKINKTGLGKTQLIPNVGVTPVCMVGDVSQLNFDSTCGCSASQSCTSFEYPKFTPTTPDALKNGGKLSVSTTNSLMSGNLSGAALDGGKLMANRSAVRSDLMRKDLSGANGNGNGNGSRSGQDALALGGSSSANAIDQANERNINRNLANLGVDKNSGSAFGRVRNSLLNSGADSNALNDKNKSDKDAQDANNRRRGGKLAGGKAGVGGNKGQATTSENFSLGDADGNLDLSGLTAEERARLGLAGADGVDATGKDIANREDRYAHVRNVTNNGSDSSVNKNDPNYGINKNRKRSLWNIISKRYEKTAFPVFLSP